MPWFSHCICFTSPLCNALKAIRIMSLFTNDLAQSLSIDFKLCIVISFGKTTSPRKCRSSSDRFCAYVETAAAHEPPLIPPMYRMFLMRSSFTMSWEVSDRSNICTRSTAWEHNACVRFLPQTMVLAFGKISKIHSCTALGPPNSWSTFSKFPSLTFFWYMHDPPIILRILHRVSFPNYP